MNKIEPIAKPSGITLREHRQHVYDEAKKLLDTRPFLSDKYRELTSEDLRRATLRAAWWHDIGKADKVGWQAACQRDYRAYQDWRKANGLDPNTVNADDYDKYEQYCYGSGKNSGANLLAFAKETGYRHEFESLLKMKEYKKETFSMAEQVAVAAHHGHLSFRSRDQERWKMECGGRFRKAWDGMSNHKRLFERDRTGHRISDIDSWQTKLLERFRFAGPRSLLQLADTRASRAEGGGWIPPIQETSPFPYAFPVGWKRRGVQQEIENLWDDPVAMLRAPTGSGKTDASLLWIKHQVENGRADRGVIAMPTRFTSNALELNIRQNISETGLYHSSAWYSRFGGTSGSERSDAREHHKLARLLIPPITVCTIDHLLIALTGTKEDHHAVFFNLMNSAVVFDEVDFYDPFVQANLTVLLETLRTFHVPVLMMSATLPESSRELYKVERNIVEAAEEPRKHSRRLSWVGAIKFETHGEDDDSPTTLPEPIERVLHEMIKEGTGIIYANTVVRASRYSQWLQEHGVPDNEVVTYHSRFTEPDKKAVEERLVQMLGKSAWSTEAKGIAILTQIGEMSVNISSPTMLTELCPWDRLAQRAGRNGRFDVEGEATLYVGLPIDDDEINPAPYGTYKKGEGWCPSVAFDNTYKRFEELFAATHSIEIDSMFFVDEVNGVYPSIPEFEGGPEENAARLRNWMGQSWMIVPARSADEEDGTLEGVWKSRDIDPQTTVFVSLPEVCSYPDNEQESKMPVFHFRNWDAFRNYELEFGISVSSSLCANEKRQNEDSLLIERQVVIGDDPDPQTITVALAYDQQTGLAWLGDPLSTSRRANNVL